MKSVSLIERKTAQDPVPLVEVAAGGYQEPLIVSTYGEPGVGKSRLIGTAPGNIGVIPMEHKSRQSILKAAAEFGRTVIMPERDLLRVGNPMRIALLPAACVTAETYASKNWKDEDKEKQAAREMDRISKELVMDGPEPECCAMHAYRAHINRVKSVAFRMAEDDDIRTIAIDTFGQFVEDMLFANYGRTDKIIPLEKKSFNQEVRDFLNAISHKNLILTHHSAQIWKDNKPVPGKTKPASSFAKIGHYTSVAVHQKRSEVGEAEVSYTLQVLDCQANASLIGLDLLFDDGITFAALANAVYVDSPDGYWD